MFSTTGGVDPQHSELQAALGSVALTKSIGATNVGGLAYGISPSSTSSIKDMRTALQDNGLKMGYENLSVPFGTTDVSADVLAMKNAGINMAMCSCVQSTVLAMVTGLGQSGSKANSLSFASADSSLFADASAAAAAQNVYYSSTIPPVDTNNAASNTFEANIKAVDPSLHGGHLPQLRYHRCLSRGRPHGGGPTGGRAQSHPAVVHHQPDQGDKLECPRIAPHRRELQPLRHVGALVLRVLRPRPGKNVRCRQWWQGASAWTCPPT